MKKTISQLSIQERIEELKKESIGSQYLIEGGAQDGRKGTCQDVRLSMFTISCATDRTQEEYGFEMKIKPIDGSRAFWTKAFPTGVATPNHVNLKH